ncbi:MAG: uroporphyrinogen decarboxylase family protein [Acidobacteriota bacterium]|nr:uroporphyrinogen decarboxylase family protein [Acidobacteriota bacterium]
MAYPRLAAREAAPDAARFIDVLMGRVPAGRPPLVEYLIDAAVQKPIVTGLLGRTWADFGPDRASQAAYLDNQIELWRRLGYDFVRFETGFGFAEPLLQADDSTSASGRRGWADEHGGSIRRWDDFERYPWPRLQDFDFFPFEYLSARLPQGLGLVACHAGGVFEHLSWIMSLEGLAFALSDDRGLVRAVADRIGGLMLGFYEHLADLPGLAAIFPGDDMGFKTGTLVSPADLREFVLPWHARFATLAHGRGLPYFLHSCGNLAAVLPDLIGTVGIDGKHSFEDVILPAEDFQLRWGGRVATLGGVDLNILAKGTEEDVRRRTRALIETCGPRGRFAVGSGNSIPSYVPVCNYLAMIDEALRVRD